MKKRPGLEVENHTDVEKQPAMFEKMNVQFKGIVASRTIKHSQIKRPLNVFCMYPNSL